MKSKSSQLKISQVKILKRNPAYSFRISFYLFFFYDLDLDARFTIWLCYGQRYKTSLNLDLDIGGLYPVTRFIIIRWDTYLKEVIFRADINIRFIVQFGIAINISHHHSKKKEQDLVRSLSKSKKISVAQNKCVARLSLCARKGFPAEANPVDFWVRNHSVIFRMK